MWQLDSDHPRALNFIFLPVRKLTYHSFTKYLWRNIWFIQENVPCTLEKKVYSAAVGWNVLSGPFALKCSSNPVFPY